VFEVVFYKNRKGREPVLEYIQELDRRKDKDSRIKVNKIYDYIEILSRVGTLAGEPYIKHLEGEIWEIRPIRDRICFSPLDDKSFILLHRFMKKTRETPQREINQAKQNLADYRKRKEENDGGREDQP
jgi:phage-related protein